MKTMNHYSSNDIFQDFSKYMKKNLKLTTHLSNLIVVRSKNTQKSYFPLFNFRKTCSNQSITQILWHKLILAVPTSSSKHLLY